MFNACVRSFCFRYVGFLGLLLGLLQVLLLLWLSEASLAMFLDVRI